MCVADDEVGGDPKLDKIYKKLFVRVERKGTTVLAHDVDLSKEVLSLSRRLGSAEKPPRVLALSSTTPTAAVVRTPLPAGTLCSKSIRCPSIASVFGTHVSFKVRLFHARLPVCCPQRAAIPESACRSFLSSFLW